MKQTLAQLLFVFTLLIICNFDAFGQVTDIDGNTYKTKKIGDQIWMTENLRTTRFSNGDPITHIGEDTIWLYHKVPLKEDIEHNMLNGELNYEKSLSAKHAVTGNTMWVQNILDNGDNFPCYLPYKYLGVENSKAILYNGPAVSDSRGVCPKGWHVPTINDWHKLMLYYGGWVQDDNIPCDKGIVTKLKGNPGWSFQAKNTSGFSARPTKGVDTEGKLYWTQSYLSWASDTFENGAAMYGIEIENFLCNKIKPFITDRNAGMPCRCIKGEEGVKWEDLTEEEQNKWPQSSVSVKWYTQKYETKEKPKSNYGW